MNMTFENQGTNTYLVYEIHSADDLDSMSLGMLTNNKIPGLAEASFFQIDTTKYIKFNVSAKVTVSQLFSGPVNKKRLIGVFNGIINAMLSAEEYMLDTDTMLLDLDYIFTDVSTCETVLVCLPVMNMERKNPDLAVFFKNIMFNTQFDQTENCDHVAQIINYLNSNPVVSLAEFKSLLEQVMRPRVEKKAPRPQMESNRVEQPKAPAVEPQYRAPQVYHQDVQPQPQMPVQNNKPISNALVLEEIEQPPVEQPEEKPISMFYLLQHYNKENAAKYKAQKAAKKEKKTETGQKAAGKAKKETAAPQINAGFVIPGQENNQTYAGFAIPGQQREAKPVQPVAVKQQPVVPQPVVKQQPVVIPQPPVQPVVAKPARSISFGETTVLSDSMGGTTVLCADEEPAVQQMAYLIRMRNNERIPIDKPVFRIGKERSYADYCIGDNAVISRSHANIVSRNGEYFVIDTNSTNHTYVNGTMIQSNIETLLSNGTMIRFANEEFEFKLQ